MQRLTSMGQLTPIILEDGTTIYIEAIESTSPVSDLVIPANPVESDNPSRGGIFPDQQQQLPQTFQAIESTIRAYNLYVEGIQERGDRGSQRSHPQIRGQHQQRSRHSLYRQRQGRLQHGNHCQVRIS